MNGKKFRRSSKDYTFAGICGGLGEYANVNSAIFRILFIALTLWKPIVFLIYILLWLILPSDEDN